MKILKFDIKKGVFHYFTNDLNIDTHSHPTLEILSSKNGTFSIETDFGTQTNLTFAIIDANLNHKVYCKENEREVLLIESYNLILKEFLTRYEINLINGIYASKVFKYTNILIPELLEFIDNNNLKLTNDKRIYECIQIIESEKLPYNKLINSLTSKIFLSESRLSHLFKINVGISVKRYFAWNNLKYALKFFLIEEVNLKVAAYEAGFTDQAHLSNTFKKYLGINPAKVFNSRIIQL